MQRNNNEAAGGGSGTHNPACAACKHQRKKCDENCVLAPYFPANRSREFQAVHKVFGVANVQKIVKFVGSAEDRRRVADSLIWEALCRQKDPVLGPYGEYKRLLEELRLHRLQNQQLQGLTTCKALAANNIIGCNVNSSTNMDANAHNSNTNNNNINANNNNASRGVHMLRYSHDNGNDDFVANLSSCVFPSNYLQHPEKIKQECHQQIQSPSLAANITPQFYYSPGQYNWQDDGR